MSELPAVQPGPHEGHITEQFLLRRAAQVKATDPDRGRRLMRQVRDLVPEPVNGKARRG